MGVRAERDGDVEVLTLESGNGLNSLDDELTADLVGHLERISGDGSVAAIVLTGSDRAFSAGGDLTMLAARTGDALAERPQGESDGAAGPLERTMRGNARVVELLLDLPCPSVAAVNGACVGAGLAWAAACDVRLAADQAFFDTAYLRLGIGTDFGTAWLLHHLLGPAVAADWLLRPRRICAAEALHRGFVGTTVEATDGTDVNRQALALARDLAATPEGARAVRASLTDARNGVPIGEALDGEAQRFVTSLASPQAAERIHDAVEATRRRR